jgi:purine-binding chemotaxis protein CheW
MQPAAVPTHGGKYVVVQVADHAYALPIASVREIVLRAELSEPPAAPSLLAGFLDVGGQLIGVVSLRRLWSLGERTPELYTPLVILKAPSARVALEVDAVERIVDVEPGDILPVDDGSSFNDCAAAIARIGGATVVLLSPERLLAEQENARIAELAQIEQRRLNELTGATP